jgi:hypothetical protein
MQSFNDYLARKKKEFGDKFDSSDLNRDFIRAFETGDRVMVSFRDKNGNEIDRKNGIIRVTSGWKPVFLLMKTSRSIGSSDTIGKNDIIVKTIRRESVESPHQEIIATSKDINLVASATGLVVIYPDGSNDYFASYPDGSIMCSNPDKCPKEFFKKAEEYFNVGGSDYFKMRDKMEVAERVKKINQEMNKLEQNLVSSSGNSKVAELLACFEDINKNMNTIKSIFEAETFNPSGKDKDKDNDSDNSETGEDNKDNDENKDKDKDKDKEVLFGSEDKKNEAKNLILLKTLDSVVSEHIDDLNTEFSVVCDRIKSNFCEYIVKNGIMSKNEAKNFVDNKVVLRFKIKG